MINKMKNFKTKEELEELALSLIKQMTGKDIDKDNRCELQGAPEYQIAMYYLRLVNNK